MDKTLQPIIYILTLLFWIGWWRVVLDVIGEYRMKTKTEKEIKEAKAALAHEVENFIALGWIFNTGNDSFARLLKTEPNTGGHYRWTWLYLTPDLEVAGLQTSEDNDVREITFNKE